MNLCLICNSNLREVFQQTNDGHTVKLVLSEANVRCWTKRGKCKILAILMRMSFLAALWKTVRRIFFSTFWYTSIFLPLISLRWQPPQNPQISFPLRPHHEILKLFPLTHEEPSRVYPVHRLLLIFFLTVYIFHTFFYPENLNCFFFLTAEGRRSKIHTGYGSYIG